MALQIDFADAITGIAIPASYVRIIRLMSYEALGEGGMQVTVGYYKDEAARYDGKAPVLTKSFLMESFDHTQQRSVKAMLYDHLKTLPEFTGATDVLEEPPQ